VWSAGLRAVEHIPWHPLLRGKQTIRSESLCAARHRYAQRLWTSQSLLVDGGRDGPELCGIINAALRLDDPALAPPLAVVARAINQARPFYH
jgi:hypothetical protein